MIRILVADDHDIVRTGVRHILELTPDFEVAGEAGTGREALQMCRELNPDVLLLDLDMPDMDGLDVIVNLHASMPKIRIIVLTMHDKEDYAARAIKSGAAGFLLKGSKPGDLPTAVRAVVEGKSYVAAEIAEKLALRYCADAGTSPIEKLSMREMQIITRLARDMKLREIAEELNLSVSTVSTYKQRITDKFGLKRRGDYVEFARKYDLIS